MMGAIGCGKTTEELLEVIRRSPRYEKLDFVAQVSTPQPYVWEERGTRNEERGPFPPLLVPSSLFLVPHVVVLDCGLKYNILRILHSLGCRVTVVPSATTAEAILAMSPDGILLSPGPGDPARLGHIVDTVKGLLGKKPIMGICLGHQMLGMAFGARTFKLKFGHRGANHPVKDLLTGQVHITAQNHGYALDADTLKGGAQVSHVNLNDNTVEGLTHLDLPIVSIQYHSEASPGPVDNVYLFERFMEMVRGNDV